MKVASELVTPELIGAAATAAHAHPFSSVLPATSTSVKATDIFEARRTADAMLPSTAVASMKELAGGLGLPPILHAIALGQPMLAALFVGIGASFSQRTASGTTALNVALFYKQLTTARWLMSNAKIRSRLYDTEIWIGRDDVRTALSTLTQNASPEQIDACVAKLAGVSAETFHCTDDLVIYLSHAASLNDTPFKHNVEGFNVATALTLRLRALVDFYGQCGNDTTRSLLLDEICCNLEALREQRRLTTIALTTDTAVRDDALEIEISATVERMHKHFDGLEGARPYMLPLTTQKHAVYLSVSAKDDKLVVHVDNRGEGSLFHVQLPPDVYPLVFELPRSDDGYRDLQRLLFDLYQEAASGTILEVYEKLMMHIASVSLDNPRTLHDPRGNELLTLLQQAGNCTYASLTPGLLRRLGNDTYEAFRKYEIAIIKRLITGSITDERIDSAIAERKRSLESTLLQSRARNTL